MFNWFRTANLGNIVLLCWKYLITANKKKSTEKSRRLDIPDLARNGILYERLYGSHMNQIISPRIC